MQDPIVLMWARRLGATIIYTPLDGPGDCEPLTRTIRINLSATPIEQRCTGMHELGHIYHGHGLSGIVTPSMEEQADWWAAEQLISDLMLEDAIEIGRDPREVAEILNVDEHTLTARLGLARSTRPGLTLVASRGI